MLSIIRQNKDSVLGLIFTISSILFVFFYHSHIGNKPPVPPSVIYKPAQVPPVGALPQELIKPAVKKKNNARVRSVKVSKDSLFFSYKVKKDDTIWSIAQRYHLPTESIAGCNLGMNLRYLHAGKTLTLPRIPGTLHLVRRGQTLSYISRLYHVKPASITKYNKIKDNKLSLGQNLFIPNALPIYRKEVAPFIRPLNTWVTSPFGPRYNPIFKRREFHPGIDIAGVVGQRIRAAKGGVVYSVGFIKGYGLMIILKHPHGYSTRYAHLRKSYVKVNEHIYQGQYIGEVGTSGLTTGAHLHLEIRKNGYVLNPEKFLHFSQ